MKTLLLNSSYEPISFISERKVIKMLLSEKAEVISFWKGVFLSKSIELPSVIKMKYYIRWIPQKVRFTKTYLLKRDRFKCQYCSKLLGESESTIDHIVPASRGGKLTWLNCVAACKSCNNKKGNKTPEEADMKLISNPYIPRVKLDLEYEWIKQKHPDWHDYFH